MKQERKEYLKNSKMETKLTNTKKISLCENCNCMTYILMDEDGKRYCGKCKKEKTLPKP